MNIDSWLEMPVTGGAVANDPVRPVHEIGGSALLVYRGDRVYVTVDDPDLINRFTALPDVRVLSPDEVGDFEATLPGAGAFTGRRGARLDRADSAVKDGRLGLGDMISWLAGRLRIRECRACSQRRKTLNRVVSWRLRKR